MFLAISSFVTLLLLASNELVVAHTHYHDTHHYHRHYHHHPRNHHDQDHSHHSRKQFHDKSASPQRIITVDQSGNGDFSKIQSAIDSVPSNNKQWIHINVNAGTYREKLKIPEDKPYIMLKGMGKDKTFVEWDDHDSSAQSPTFLTMANDIVVKTISFRNSFNDPKKGTPMTPAVAAMISGDRSSFYGVGFYSLQDTLWDDKGRHYFNSCTIEGAMDFIFGAGQSLYESCSISVREAYPGKAIIGFITAQGRMNADDENGFVFKNCNIHGVGKTYLGRPWRAFARVLFYKTTMSSIIQPLGWQPWNPTADVGGVEFSEYDNMGPGSSLSGRVSWLKKLDSSTLMKMTSTQFVDPEGWLKTHHML
ncbi:hypothetical protein LR48_Vigan06g138400 [Vigna angularis]|uniref:pectinesterase n=2 Tax=Phaseolus angularis TaxID=3914 RepID=A0A0L9UTL1_PHAAN|nr:probable pectinesterase 55 [Vigna angularis]KOM46078.1 hypothetical protein LR48_Vigan06g138400 [Vigna angularis]